MELFALANKFVNDTKPWEIGKENPELTKKILAVLGWYLVLVGVIMRPYLPFTSQIILHTLIEDQELDAQTIGDRFDARNYKKMTEKPEHLFVKITDEQIEEEMAKLNN
jgi:methionyl-tRNA synthetase